MCGGVCSCRCSECYFHQYLVFPISFITDISQFTFNPGWLTTNHFAIYSFIRVFVIRRQKIRFKSVCPRNDSKCHIFFR